jgi:hypothetical protein
MDIKKLLYTFIMVLSYNEINQGVIWYFNKFKILF